MLLSKNIYVNLSYATKKHYLNKGYDIPKDKSEKLLVNVNDLLPGSNYKVKVECDFCHSVKEIRYSTYINNYGLVNFNKFACQKCSPSLHNKLDFSVVIDSVESLGYKMLSNKDDYKDEKSKLNIKCDKGHIYETSYDVIRTGCKCPICFKLYGNRGEENPNYNPNLTDDEREDKRDILKNKNWKKDVYKKDNYTCQCCGKRGIKLNAHHLNGYHWDKENRFNISNGITLCEDCHKEFHNLYGYKYNTEYQFKEFLNSKVN